MRSALRPVGRWLLGRYGLSTCVLTILAYVAAYRWFEPSLTTAAAIPFVAAVVVGVIASWWDDRTAPGTPAFARARKGADASTLREDPNGAVFSDRGGYLFGRRHWFVGTGCPPVRLRGALAAEAEARQRTEAVQIAVTETRTYWWFEDRFCWENQNLEPRDVMALLRERDRRRRRGLDRAHLSLKVDDAGERRRSPIPENVRRAVFERDGGRCVECGTTFGIQYDHVIPWSMGGADTVENLQILCTTCNQTKGATV